MLQRPFYRKISPSVTDVGAVCNRPRAPAGRPYGFFCEFFAILQQALPECQKSGCHSEPVRTLAWESP